MLFVSFCPIARWCAQPFCCLVYKHHELQICHQSNSEPSEQDTLSQGNLIKTHEDPLKILIFAELVAISRKKKRPSSAPSPRKCHLEADDEDLQPVKVGV